MKRAPLATFVLFTALYLACGCYLALVAHYTQGDALSRVSDVRAALFSRDPHLAAIGFVFTPLTALAQLPFVAMSDFFPGLTRWGLTGILVSAPAMAGAVTQVHLIARERGCPRWACLLLVLGVGLHPMIVYYGANGMSEAFFVLFITWAAHRCIRWFSTDDIHDLMFAGIALGLGYLTRYDALAAGATATAVVFGYSVARRRGVQVAILDAIVIAVPTALAFVAWAATSWLVTGHAFEQFSSDHGNSAILAQSGGGSSGGFDALLFAGAEIFVLAPALGVLAVICGVVAVRRRDAEPLAALLPASIVVFASLIYVGGMTFPFLRFYICAIPLVALLAIFLFPRQGPIAARRSGAHATERRSDSTELRVLLTGIGVFAIVLSLPSGYLAIVSPTFSQEQHALRSAAPLFPDAADGDQRLDDEATVRTFATERQIADIIDEMDLPDGSVLMDTLQGFAIFAATDRPKAFIVPSDRDFVESVNAPSARGVQYILTVPNEGRGASDAVNRRFPTIYDDGSEIATLELEIENTGLDRPNWRLWRVLP